MHKIVFPVEGGRQSVMCSMDRACDCWGGAAMEGLFSALKGESTIRKTYRTRDEAKVEALDSVELLYNPRLRHAELGCFSPVAFEEQATLA